MLKIDDIFLDRASKLRLNNSKIDNRSNKLAHRNVKTKFLKTQKLSNLL